MLDNKLFNMFRFQSSLVKLVILIAWCKENFSLQNEVVQFIYSSAFWITLVLTLLTYDYDYWSQMGMFSPPAFPFVGHIWKMAAFKEHTGLFFKQMYDTYKNKRFIGIHQFFGRTVIICDPELIRRICVNDFQYFTDRGFFFDKELDPLAESLIYLRGNQWKSLRSKVSPIFSPIKLKGMIPLLDETANNFVKKVRKLIEDRADDTGAKEYKNRQDGDDTMEVDSIDDNAERNEAKNGTRGGKIVKSNELFEGYTADAIVPCAFGVKSHFMDDPNDPFAVALKAFYECSFRNVLNKSLHYFCPMFAIFMKIRNVPKKTHEFFCNVVLNVIRDRHNGVQEKRGDFIDMMMALQTDERNHNTCADKESDVNITDMVISANAFLVLLGGYETTSSTLAFLFLELAEQPEIQEKMRAEIEEVLERHGGRVSHEMLQNLTYMEMVIQETLRLYPPFPSIQRLCTKDYVVPGTELTVEQGTIVIFPNLGIHRDEQYFENASCFVPERWSADRPQPAGGVYMPFGDGPRYCIGKRFAMLQMKCCLVKLMPHLKISPAPRQHGAGGAGCDSDHGPRSTPREPLAVDLHSPMTLHPADARITLTLL